jgi:hypothetical protein
MEYAARLPGDSEIAGEASSAPHLQGDLTGTAAAAT